MSYYHILEVRKVDEEGHILSHEFFVVDGGGNIVDGPFNDLQAAINRLQELDDEDTPPPPSSSGPICGM